MHSHILFLVIILLTSYSSSHRAGGFEVGNGRVINAGVLLGNTFLNKQDTVTAGLNYIDQLKMNSATEIYQYQKDGVCRKDYAAPKKIKLVEYYPIRGTTLSYVKNISAYLEIELKDCQKPNSLKIKKPFLYEFMDNDL